MHQTKLDRQLRTSRAGAHGRPALLGSVAASMSAADPSARARLALHRLIWLCLGLICLGSVAGVLVPAGLGWDFANFYDAGRKALHGQLGDLYDPTAWIAGRPPQGRMAFFSAPVTAFLYAPLALLPAEAALISFKIQNVLATWCALYIIWRRLSPAGSEDRSSRIQLTAALLLLALLFQPFWTIFRSGGQSMPTVLLLLLLGWTAHENRRVWLSAGCFIAAAAIKPFLAPGLALLMAVSGPSFLIAASALGLASAAVSIGVLGWPVHAAMLQKLLADAGAIVAPQYNSGLLAALDAVWLGPDGLRPGLPRPDALAATGAAVRAALFAAFLWMALRGKAGDGRVGSRGLASWRYLLAMLLPVFVTPVAWEHYLTLLFPALAIAVAGWSRFNNLSRRLLVLVVVLCIGRNLVVMMWVTGHVGFSTLPQQLAVSLFNSAPLLTALAWLLSAHATLFSVLNQSLDRQAQGVSR